MIAEKMCTKCKTVKPVTEFYKNRNSKDGYHHSCKECHKKSQLYDKELKERADMLMAFRTLKYEIKHSKDFEEA